MYSSTNEVDFNADILNISDLQERLEYLKDMERELEEGENTEDEMQDFLDNHTDEILALMVVEDMDGAGQLIADHYFTEYARELCIDIGDVPRDLPEYISINWEETADNIKPDYMNVELGKYTFWYHE